MKYRKHHDYPAFPLKSTNLSPEANALYQFILHCPQRNRFGCFKLPLDIITMRCGDNDQKKARRILDELVGSSVIAYDYRSEIIAVSKWFDHRRPSTLTPSDCKQFQKVSEGLPPNSEAFRILTRNINICSGQRK